MLKLINYLLSTGVSTVKDPHPKAPPEWRGLPARTDAACDGGCNACVEMCPTDAINIFDSDGEKDVAIDLGACIQCGLCFENCPTGTIAENKSYEVATVTREDLVLVKDRKHVPEVIGKTDLVPKKYPAAPEPGKTAAPNIFSQSLHARVVSTGCSACDAEIGASGNPVFDLERFGVHIVASPRYADALFVTGPVSKGMQTPTLRCYGAMADPRVVVALGTCAISGGVHRGGYAQGNGVNAILPVDVYIPGCPPHPWSIVHGVLVGMGRREPFKQKIWKQGETPG